MKRILVTGSYGQIGTELVGALRKRYGGENVIATGRKKPPKVLTQDGPYFHLDILDTNEIHSLLVNYDIDIVIHNASVLSAVGEKNPQLAYKTNVEGAYNVLEAVRALNLDQVMIPSSIAAFGPSTPKDNTPNDVIMRPTTMYGVTKVFIELLGEYYTQRFGTDFRSLRYPGIISSEALPGGGTTDYAVEIFYEALKNKKYTCFLAEDAELPMMYMPDCIKSTIDLIEADASRLVHRSFNVTAMSFTPAEIAEEIKKHIPEFEITYEPDFRQKIAQSWPRSIDDSAAREEWGWKPDYDLSAMVKDMLGLLSKRLGIKI
ncbi:MAG: NAD-dependent epimerase [Candidatus Thorarchaeota archaeon]|nr:MAG: NAD-dependent epimerase [Candidatus Thorarchaeota archaeon]RLI58690.1 MAG: NAD-dependent epimerase [Candidatus Thorarchaeota archaeon]